MSIALLSAQRARHFTTVDRQWVVTAYTLAFGIYGAIAAAGSVVGLLLGGALTEYLSWRWTLYVNPGLRGRRLAGAALLLLNTIFAGAVAAYVTAHAAPARTLGRQALTGLALAHGYDTAFWWTAGIFAVGAVICGILLRRGPLNAKDAPAPQVAGRV
jgi:MFS family permease